MKKASWPSSSKRPGCLGFPSDMAVDVQHVLAAQTPWLPAINLQMMGHALVPSRVCIKTFAAPRHLPEEIAAVKELTRMEAGPEIATELTTKKTTRTATAFKTTEISTWVIANSQLRFALCSL